MNAINGWNDVAKQQQLNFLTQAGIDRLPAPAEMNNAQWTILNAVLGEDATSRFRAAVPVSLACPSLPAPILAGDWKALSTVAAALQDKVQQMPDRLAAGQGLRKAGDVDAKWAAVLEQLAKAFAGGNAGAIGAAGAPGTFDNNAARIFIAILGGLAGLAFGIVSLTAKDEDTKALFGKLACGGLLLIAMSATGNEQQYMAIMRVVRENLIPILDLLGIRPGFLDDNFLSILTTVGQNIVNLISAFFGENAPPPNFQAQLEGVAKMVRREAAAINPEAVSGDAATFRINLAKLEENPDDRAWLAKLRKAVEEQQIQLRRIMEQLNSGIVDAGAMLAELADSKQKVSATIGA